MAQHTGQCGYPPGIKPQGPAGSFAGVRWHVVAPAKAQEGQWVPRDGHRGAQARLPQGRAAVGDLTCDVAPMASSCPALTPSSLQGLSQQGSSLGGGRKLSFGNSCSLQPPPGGLAVGKCLE